MLLLAFAGDKGIFETEQLEAALLGVARQEVEAMERLYHLMRDPVFAYALSMLKNIHDAEDVLQDCFVKVWQSAQGYSSMGKPMAWIFTLTRNLCLDRLRQRKYLSDKPMEDWQQLLDGRPMDWEDKLLIQGCLQQLSQEEREIFLLHCFWGLKHREIAGLLGRPTATVLSKYHRSVKKMRQWLHLEEDSYGK